MITDPVYTDFMDELADPDVSTARVMQIAELGLILLTAATDVADSQQRREFFAHYRENDSQAPVIRAVLTSLGRTEAQQ